MEAWLTNFPHGWTQSLDFISILGGLADKVWPKVSTVRHLISLNYQVWWKGLITDIKTFL